MSIDLQEFDRSILPMFCKLKGNHDVYILNAVGRGLQLIKADKIMLQLLAQH